MVKAVFSGDIIGQIDCPGCGAPVNLKVNKNQCVYLYCNAPTGEGERCFTRQSFGRAASKRLIDEYLETEHHTEGETDDVFTEEKEQEPTEQPATREPEKRSGGVLGALGHFFTGE